ncbi:hypothetical protein PVAND_008316 [Polypedilum vanderplanki]|uniref:Uncharacterized protein n=1 Tax=Polypedilum vanderplanki TaxID=319348 RepID=A0A9J6C9S8_POLVA|nr:hypothetical protein PVAND_008316 [Polypedilum vanderplanki]
MKAPKTKVALIAIYCIISGLVYIALAILAICSYACVLDFTKTPVAYMLYLLYFRTRTCHNDIKWDALGIEGVTSSQPSTPKETSAVLRTLTFSIIYLLLNLILIVAAFRAMVGLRERAQNRHILFWSYFAALFLTFIIITALDFLSSAFYLIEFFLTFYNSDNVMNILEIDNIDEFRQYFSQLSINTRSMPSMILFLVTSKVLLILTFNFALIYAYFTAAWKIVRENQKFSFQVKTVEKKIKKKEPSPIMSIKSLNSDATIVVGTNKNEKTMTTTNTTQTETHTPSNVENDDNSSRNSSEGIPELKLPRVPYEKTTFEYYPRSNTLERSLRRY